MGARGLVLFSAGLDSLATLILAKEEALGVKAIHYSYGQNNEQQELEQSRVICDELKVELIEVDLNPMKDFLNSKYTSGDFIDAFTSSYVPNRNALFITLAHSYAKIHGFDTLYCGLAGTPLADNISGTVGKFDRPRFTALAQELEGGQNISDGTLDFMLDIKKLLETHQEPNEKIVKIAYPLQGKLKSYCYKVVEEANVFNLVEDSISCYNGEGGSLMDGSIGCSVCGSCRMREMAYMKYSYERGRA